MRLILLWLVLFACLPSQAEPPVTVKFTTPPPFGYSVGSIIHHQIELFVPTPWQLDIAQLPTQGQLNRWLEIRDFAYAQWRENGGIRYRLRIDYQIFPSLQQALVLEIPSVSLPLTTPTGKRQVVSIPPWSFATNPLIPAQWSDAQVKVRPLWQPQAIDLSPHWQRLAEISAGLLAVGLILTWRHYRLPLQRLPFARALPKIRQAVRKRETEAAFLAFHQALNETAGQALFAGQLADFLARKPAFAPLKEEFQQFFEKSQQFFYRRQQTPATDWLIALERLCRACTKTERQCRK